MSGIFMNLLIFLVMKANKIAIVVALIFLATFISWRAGVLIYQLPIEWGVQPGDWLMITPIAFMAALLIIAAYVIAQKAIKMIGD
jgi:hypothetical protein